MQLLEKTNMSNILKFALLTLVLVVGGNTAAHANPAATSRPKTAPEVDPSLAVVGVSLLAGTLTVLRARKRK
jgi:LPXTG-motif cell wall-anchored protein